MNFIIDNQAAIMAFVAAYLFGSLPGAVIICKLMRLPDPRTFGSKNPGATNVLRTGNKTAATLTLLFDALKAVIPVLVGKQLGFDNFILSLIMLYAVIGHMFPVFLKFKGGKGVSTSIGGLLALAWPIALLVIATWFFVALFTRYSSLAAIIATLLAPVYLWMMNYDQMLMATSIVAMFLLYRHNKNIKRLLEGTESKIGKK